MEPAILFDRETPRNKRFEAEDLEQRLIDAAGPHLRALRLPFDSRTGVGSLRVAQDAPFDSVACRDTAATG
jgi:hypothetical protein